jgi:hypothetical protein
VEIADNCSLYTRQQRGRLSFEKINENNFGCCCELVVQRVYATFLYGVRCESDPSQGVIMSVVGGAVRTVGRTVSRAADATTAAAGAVGGAAVNGIVGGVTGAAEGIKRGVSSGSRSTPAAALAIGALGVAGLVEWPVLLAVGGGALLLRRLNRKPEAPAKATLKPVPSAPAPKKAAPQKAASKSTAKKTSGRRAGTTALRSTN